MFSPRNQKASTTLWVFFSSTLQMTHRAPQWASQQPGPAASGGWRAGQAVDSGPPPGQTEPCPLPGRPWPPAEVGGVAALHSWGAGRPLQPTSPSSCSTSTARLPAPTLGPAQNVIHAVTKHTINDKQQEVINSLINVCKVKVKVT